MLPTRAQPPSRPGGPRHGWAERGAHPRLRRGPATPCSFPCCHGELGCRLTCVTPYPSLSVLMTGSGRIWTSQRESQRQQRPKVVPTGTAALEDWSGTPCYRSAPLPRRGVCLGLLCLRITMATSLTPKPAASPLGSALLHVSQEPVKSHWCRRKKPRKWDRKPQVPPDSRVSDPTWERCEAKSKPRAPVWNAMTQIPEQIPCSAASTG